MKLKSLLPVVLITLAVSVQAQEKKKGIIAEGGGVDERGSTRVLYWDQDKDGAAGQVAVDYGRPMWKNDYEDPAKFDTLTKGKVWRMGKDFWTVLDTQLPLKIGGRNIAPGYYYLGLHRSADGAAWSLAFFDPAQVRKARVDAFEIQKARPTFMAPVSAQKSDSTTEKLTITLANDKNNIKNVTLKVAWGNMVLTAPISVALAQ